MEMVQAYFLQKRRWDDVSGEILSFRLLLGV
jgi:hypothetical protein